MRFARLLPAPGCGGAPGWLALVRARERAAADRCFVLLNMVATVDGRASIGGSSRPIGGPADTRMLLELRGIVDAVLVGTRTVRAERYGRLVRAPERRARRAAAGLAPDPLCVLIARDLDVPWDVPLFAAPEQRVVIACARGAVRHLPETAAQVSLLPLSEPSAGAALRALRAQEDVRSVLCEGGPTLNAHLLAEGVLDELFLTLAPVLAGDPHQPGIVGEPALATAVDLELEWLLRHGDELFLRYAVAHREARQVVAEPHGGEDGDGEERVDGREHRP